MSTSEARKSKPKPIRVQGTIWPCPFKPFDCVRHSTCAMIRVQCPMAVETWAIRRSALVRWRVGRQELRDVGALRKVALGIGRDEPLDIEIGIAAGVDH